MIVAQDLCTRTGALLVPKGYRVSERLVARLANFNHGNPNTQNSDPTPHTVPGRGELGLRDQVSFTRGSQRMYPAVSGCRF
jgi:hypothetical protein